jgi:hypothetical protein
MANSTLPARHNSGRQDDFSSDSVEDAATPSPWLAVVTEKVKTMRYGVVQIVVHDSKVVQVERTERTRFEVPQSTGQR